MPISVSDLFIISPLRAMLLLLAGLLITAVLRFRKRYLAGQNYQQQFNLGVGGIAVGVAIILTTQHLLLVALGWVITNLALQQLLRLNGDRPRAVLAAHKHFLSARLGETLLFVAFLLLYLDHGSWMMNDLLSSSTLAAASYITTISLYLLVVVALLQCAQLPAHGWLMQVMEAPTPVSALLHAGVINLGGILMLLFSPLLNVSSGAQWLLLLVAGFTVVTASLAMARQVAVKTRLAWSSSAQMGLLLMECALGLYELALLHLVAHSIYKANAFLNAGQIVPRQAPVTVLPTTVSFAVSVIPALAITGIAALLVWSPGDAWAPWSLIGFTASGAAWVVHSNSSTSGWLKASLVAGAFILVYAALKTLVDSALIPGAGRVSALQDSFAFGVFFGLAVISWRLKARFAARKVPSVWTSALTSGFWLDVHVTRLALKIWPVRWPAAPAPTFSPSRKHSGVQL